MAEYFEKARKLEGRVASDEDLKTSDLLRYYVRDTEAAKNLLYRRARCLADYENANKALDKARVKGKEVAAVSKMLLTDGILAEPARKRLSRAPLLRKFGNLSSQEILVVIDT